MDEKRAHRRLLMHGVALIGSQALDNWQPVILLDMSVSGVSFTHSAVIIKGAQRTIRFRLPENSFLHQAAVRVVHSANYGVPSGYKVGAIFLELPSRTELAILEFLQKSFAQP
jgi:hypothetical protein